MAQRNSVAVLIVCGLVAVARVDPLGITILGAAGASEHELTDSQPGLREMGIDQKAALQFFEILLRSDPANRLARLSEVQLLTETAQVALAERQLTDLRSIGPNFPGALEADAMLAHVLGDRAREVKAYEQMLNRPVADPQLKATEVSDKLIIRARLLELTQPQSVARSFWLSLERPVKGVTFVIAGDEELGDFEFRAQNFLRAIDLLEKAIANKNRQTDPNGTAHLIVELAVARLCVGDRKQALSSALDACSLLSSPHSATDTFALAAQLAYGIARDFGTPAQLKDAGEYVRLELLAAPWRMPDSIAGVLAGTDSAEGVQRAAARVAAVLRIAPHMDWALWAAAMLLENHFTDCQALLPLLPGTSTQEVLVASAKSK